MAAVPPSLPAEIWTHVLGYLSVPDKLSLRVSCKYFRKLADHWSLWRGWTPVLTFRHGAYSRRFWGSLRRRKVSSVVVRSPKARNWRQLSSELPGLSAVVLERSAEENLSFGKDFPQLERLAVRNSGVVERPHLEQLTHLSLCDVKLPIKYSFHQFLSHLGNLTSLVLHNSGPTTICPVDTILSSLPKLKHLSLCFYNVCIWRPQRTVSGTISSLSTLELILYSNDFSETSLNVPHLNSFSVVWGQESQRMSSGIIHPTFLMTSWLEELPELSKLAVTRGPPVWQYANFIPATVSSIVLRSSALSPNDMSAMSAQLPNLLHLHLEPLPSPLGPSVAQIPELFPKLRSLKLHHENVPEKDFLHLHRLQDLEHLEILGRSQNASRLADQLQALTKNGVRVSTSPPQNDPMTCTCVQQLY